MKLDRGNCERENLGRENQLSGQYFRKRKLGKLRKRKRKPIRNFKSAHQRKNKGLFYANKHICNNHNEESKYS